MGSQAVQYGPAILKAMPINQKTNIAPSEQFNLDEKMPGTTSVRNANTIKMTGMGQMLDLDV